MRWGVHWPAMQTVSLLACVFLALLSSPILAAISCEDCKVLVASLQSASEDPHVEGNVCDALTDPDVQTLCNQLASDQLTKLNKFIGRKMVHRNEICGMMKFCGTETLEHPRKMVDPMPVEEGEGSPELERAKLRRNLNEFMRDLKEQRRKDL